MAYIDEDYFLARINEDDLAKLTGPEESAKDNLASAIAVADNLIDSYIGTVAEVPLQKPPEIIKQLSYDIAIFHLHDRIQYIDIPERIRDKYDAAINYLKDISSGKVNLNLDSEDNLDDTIDYGGNTRQMSREMF